MQNPTFLRECHEALLALGLRVEPVEGNRYYPVLAFHIHDFPLPHSLQEATADLTIPMPRCAGYMPDCTIMGLHVHGPLHGTFADRPTLIPFCDPVLDTTWLESVARYYPLYDTRAPEFVGTSFLCLESAQRAKTPVELLRLSLLYLGEWWRHAQAIAERHGAVLRGVQEGEPEESREWLEHLVEHVSDELRAALQAIAFPPSGGGTAG
jgi:hypothetical protein